MLSTKLYKKVHSLAEGLLNAAQQESTEKFQSQYAELLSLCEEHEGSEKNHPVQWEALADFTEESDDAFSLYKKALAIAEKESLHDYIASINYAMAILYEELGETKQALAVAEQANAQAGHIVDEVLKKEITTLINRLQPPEPPKPHPIYG